MSDYPATQRVHTPQGPVDCCDEHAQKLVGIMSFLGAHTKSEQIENGTCKNCENAANAKRSS